MKYKYQIVEREDSEELLEAKIFSSGVRAYDSPNEAIIRGEFFMEDEEIDPKKYIPEAVPVPDDEEIDDWEEVDDDFFDRDQEFDDNDDICECDDETDIIDLSMAQYY